MAKNDLVTRTFLRSYLKSELDRFGGVLEKKIVGAIIKEIKDLREEFDAHQFSHSRINDDLGELDERVSKLEKAQRTS